MGQLVLMADVQSRVLAADVNQPQIFHKLQFVGINPV